MMNAHPLADLLPAMSADEFATLTADIKENGLQHPITVYEGQILDGRHRFKACVAVGVEPRTKEFKGDEDAAIRFVYSTNLARRNLSKSQLAMVGVKMKSWYSARAKERQLAALETSGKRGIKVQANLPEPLFDQANGQARDHAAKAVGVSGRMIDKAENVMKKAIPEVVRLVENGEMAMNEASALAELPSSTQKRIVNQPTKAVRQGELKTALRRSGAGKRKKNKSELVQASDAPGTPMVRMLLSRLELLTNEIDRSGLSPQKFAECFLSEFDWKDPLQVRRLGYVSKAVEMLSTLSVMSQRAKCEAA